MRILSFDIGGTLIKTGLFDSEHGISHFKENIYELPGKDGILKLIDSLASLYDYDAIGISTAGLIDEQNGIITDCSNSIPNYAGTKLSEYIKDRFNKKAYVINDVNAAALGEAYIGAGKDYDDFLCLTFGTSVGGAIVINKTVYGGKNGFAGEFGHMITHPGGIECSCGKLGCYASYASTNALVEKANSIDPNIKNGKEVFEKFDNPAIKNEIDNWIDEIVLGLTSLCHIFNPPAIVLGGGIMHQQYISIEIEKKLRKMVLNGYERVNIHSAWLGNKAGLIGAAQNAIKRL